MKTGTITILVRCALAAFLAAAPITAAAAQSAAAPNAQANIAQPSAQGSGIANSRGLTVPVSGLVGPASATPGTPLTGTLAIQRFVRTGDGIGAVGTLTASFEDATTGVTRTIVTQVVVPVTIQPGQAQAANDELDAPEHGPAATAQLVSCQILHLVLGPLDLNLLGLRVQLNQVVLDITAVPGAGNLLGNLLCAITGLLDNTNPLAQIVTLLNQILALLG
jgi:hypothetical protein